MKLTRKIRLAAALYALVSVLFMQLAVAAHACPAGPAGNGGTAVNAMAAMNDKADDNAAPHCQTPGFEQASLCKSHCEKAAQSIGAASHATPDAPVLPLLAMVSPMDVHGLSVNFLADAWSAGISDPPPTLRFCVLRI
jgi:hypothetical protein